MANQSKQRPREELSLHDPCLSSICCSRGADNSERRRLIQMATGSCQRKDSVCVHFVQAAWQGLIATPKRVRSMQMSQPSASKTPLIPVVAGVIYNHCFISAPIWTLFASWSTTIGEFWNPKAVFWLVLSFLLFPLIFNPYWGWSPTHPMGVLPNKAPLCSCGMETATICLT